MLLSHSCSCVPCSSVSHCDSPRHTCRGAERSCHPRLADVTGLVTAPLWLGRNERDTNKVKCVPTETAVTKTRVTFFGITCHPSHVCIAEACPEGLFGARCEEHCDCGDNVSCHHVTGVCDCPRGWRGRRCEKGEPASLHPSVPPSLRQHSLQAPLGAPLAPCRAWGGEKLNF